MSLPNSRPEIAANLYKWLQQDKYEPHAPYMPQIDDDVLFLSDLYGQFTLQLPFHVKIPYTPVIATSYLRCTVTNIIQPTEQLQHQSDQIVALIIRLKPLSVQPQLHTLPSGSLNLTTITPYPEFDVLYHPFHNVADFFVLYDKVTRSLEMLSLYQQVCHQHHCQKDIAPLKVWYASNDHTSFDVSQGTTYDCVLMNRNVYQLIDSVTVAFDDNPENDANVSPWEIEFPQLTTSTTTTTMSLWQPVSMLSLEDWSRARAKLQEIRAKLMFQTQQRLITSAATSFSKHHNLNNTISTVSVYEQELLNLYALVEKRIDGYWYRTFAALNADIYQLESGLEYLFKLSSPTLHPPSVGAKEDITCKVPLEKFIVVEKNPITTTVETLITEEEEDDGDEEAWSSSSPSSTSETCPTTTAVFDTTPRQSNMNIDTIMSAEKAYILTPNQSIPKELIEEVATEEAAIERMMEETVVEKEEAMEETVVEKEEAMEETVVVEEDTVITEEEVKLATITDNEWCSMFNGVNQQESPEQTQQQTQQPMLLVNIDAHGVFTLCQEALEHLYNNAKPLVLVGMIGPDESDLHNYLFDQPVQQQQTPGIWMYSLKKQSITEQQRALWSSTLYGVPEGLQELDVLVLKCVGFTKECNAYDRKLYALTVLLSSTLIYMTGSTISPYDKDMLGCLIAKYSSNYKPTTTISTSEFLQMPRKVTDILKTAKMYHLRGVGGFDKPHLIVTLSYNIQNHHHPKSLTYANDEYLSSYIQDVFKHIDPSAHVFNDATLTCVAIPPLSPNGENIPSEVFMDRIEKTKSKLFGNGDGKLFTPKAFEGSVLLGAEYAIKLKSVIEAMNGITYLSYGDPALSSNIEQNMRPHLLQRAQIAVNAALVDAREFTNVQSCFAHMSPSMLWSLSSRPNLVTQLEHVHFEETFKTYVTIVPFVYHPIAVDELVKLWRRYLNMLTLLKRVCVEVLPKLGPITNYFSQQFLCTRHEEVEKNTREWLAGQPNNLDIALTTLSNTWQQSQQAMCSAMQTFGLSQSELNLCTQVCAGITSRHTLMQRAVHRIFAAAATITANSTSLDENISNNKKRSAEQDATSIVAEVTPAAKRPIVSV
jgi:hypothetical protein